MKKKNRMIIIIAIVLGVFAIVGGGFAYAAIFTEFGGSNPVIEETVITAGRENGSLKFTALKSVKKDDLYPGSIFIQTFSVEPLSAGGIGVFDIDLLVDFDQSFENNIEYFLYSSLDPNVDNIGIKEGDFVSVQGKGIFKEDSLIFNGIPTAITTGFLKNGLQRIKSIEYNIENYQKTTYYLVYRYNNIINDQNDQQGKQFTAKLDVKMNSDTRLSDFCHNQIASTCFLNNASKSYEKKALYSLDLDHANNLRFTGANPDNYVKFNNELWRIIGVFNNQLKIIKATSLPDKQMYSSDSITDWVGSNIQKFLDNEYYNTIDINSRNLINTNAEFNVGKINMEKLSIGEWYNDEITKKHTGKIGLMSASDYLFATNAGGDKQRRHICLSYLNNDSALGCTENDWLTEPLEFQLTMNLDIYNYVIIILKDALYFDVLLTNLNTVKPVVYLKSNAKIVGGKGTELNPYQLGI